MRVASSAISRGLPRTRFAQSAPTRCSVLRHAARSASTGKIGDGKNFVLELLETMRIRTGETGSDAL